jgi:hypothetical protein
MCVRYVADILATGTENLNNVHFKNTWKLKQRTLQKHYLILGLMQRQDCRRVLGTISSKVLPYLNPLK